MLNVIQASAGRLYILSSKITRKEIPEGVVSTRGNPISGSSFFSIAYIVLMLPNLGFSAGVTITPPLPPRDTKRVVNSFGFVLSTLTCPLVNRTM
jgi:hypothetical protein